jgi:hypothetical protein
LFAGGFALLLAYFAYFTWPSLRMGFTHDDLMNLHRSWNPHTRPGWSDFVLFFRQSHSFRPTGNLLYLVVFELFGFQALPFRIAVYLLLALNLWLVYCVTRRLSDSRLVGALSALLMAYHREFWGFYVNTGMCYDLLCLTFFLGGFLFYLRGNIAGWAVCYLFCLNSKEVAVAMPAVMICYELIYRRPVQWKVPLAAGVVAAAFVFGRVLHPQGISGGNARYQVDISLGAYLAHAHYYLRAALYRWPTTAISAVIGLAMIGWAWKSGSKSLRLGLAWTLIAILPLAFIPQRELDSACVALVGFSLYVATLLAGMRRFAPPAVVFAVALIALGAFHARYGLIDFEDSGREGREIEAVTSDLLKLESGIPRHARILFVNDPFPAVDYSSLMLMRLLTRDPEVEVFRPGRMGPAGQSFDRVLSWEKGHLAACRAVPAGETHWDCGKPLSK